MEFIGPQAGEGLHDFGRRAGNEVEQGAWDIAIFDSAGRLQVDAELVQELKELKAILAPRNAVLVLDAAIGQEAVNVAETFHREIGLTGLILTKLDGDARGGAALSVQHVAQCPILMVGVGERPEDVQPFDPDRFVEAMFAEN